MSQEGFYLLFIPGLTVTAVAIGFTFSIFALNQGEFQRATRKGLLSLVTIVLLAVVLGLLAVRLDHLSLPPRGG